VTLAIVRREIVARRAPLAIGLVLVLAASIALPNVYAYTVGRAAAFARVASAQELLRSFGSYEFFLVNDWVARDFARVLCLLALVVGPGTLAGERELGTYALLFNSPAALRRIVLAKYATLVTWLALVAAGSTCFAGAASALVGRSFSPGALAVATVVAWAQAAAFLALVMAASAVARRVPIAAALGFAAALAAAGVLRLLGIDGGAVGFSAFDRAGAIAGGRVVADLVAMAALVAIGLAAALVIVTRRRTT